MYLKETKNWYLQEKKIVTSYCKFVGNKSMLCNKLMHGKDIKRKIILKESIKNNVKKVNKNMIKIHF